MFYCEPTHARLGWQRENRGPAVQSQLSFLGVLFIRILICWSRVSGYMAACWKRLAAVPEMNLRVVAWSTNANADQSAFAGSIVDGVNCRLLSTSERGDGQIIQDEIAEFQPDVVVIPGWMSDAYTTSILKLQKNGPAVVMGMDTPWTGGARQYLTRWRFNALFRRVDRVVVAGERAWQYARWLGFAETQISRVLYAWDESSFGSDSHLPRRTNLPKSFVFVGRLAEEKGIRTLLKAYQEYRETASVPWTLTMCGTGPLSSLIQGDGIECHGFVQPSELPSVFENASVMVLPSHYEPWGVALAESMGAGLPVIASEACGAAVDLVRPYWNGLLVPTRCESALADALLWFHNHTERLPEMGMNARQSAEPFSASNWAVRWNEMFRAIAQRNAA
ncbi:MAG: glycosyltransferase family 4 protein [Fuerstiella sp.]